jgi:hypothetical protein
MSTKLWEGTKILGNVTAYGHEFTVHHCGECGLVFAIDDEFDEARRADHRGWACPNSTAGFDRHGFQYYGESKLERARREKREAEERAEVAQRQVKATRDLLSHEERRSAAARGQVTKIKKRVAAGVCPCCNRTFQDLAKHMAGQHPDYVKAV